MLKVALIFLFGASTLRKKMMTHLPPQTMLTCTKTHKIPREDAGIRHALTHYKVLEYYEHHALVELSWSPVERIRLECIWQLLAILWWMIIYMAPLLN